MQKFKVGDVVELDEKADDYAYAKKVPDLQGKIVVTDVDKYFVYCGVNRFSNKGWNPARFKLVTPAEEVKPVDNPKPSKKPHAWALVKKQDNSIDSVWTTRSKARNNRDGWVSAYKVKKVFLEFAD